MHEAPTRGDAAAPLHNVTGIYPDDIYSSMAARYYGHYGDARDYEAISVIQAYRGKPNKAITVYRAIPSDVKGNALNVGDWVTTVRAYAKEHGEATLQGEYRIVKKMVYARDLFTDGNSIYEWGYDPQPVDQAALADLRARQKAHYAARGPSALTARILGNPGHWPSGSFNAWIDTKGVVYLTNGMTHDRWIRNKMDLNINDAMDDGWIRISVAQFSILETGNIIKSLPVIQRALRSLYEERGNFDLWIEDRGNEIDRKIDLATLVLGNASEIRNERDNPSASMKELKRVWKMAGLPDLEKE